MNLENRHNQHRLKHRDRLPLLLDVNLSFYDVYIFHTHSSAHLNRTPWGSNKGFKHVQETEGGEGRQGLSSVSGQAKVCYRLS